MKDLFVLVFAVAVGLIAGTMPGVREKFPWGQPSEAEVKAKDAAVAAQQAVLQAATPAPATGSWMHDPNARAGTLEKKAVK